MLVVLLPTSMRLVFVSTIKVQNKYALSSSSSSLSTVHTPTASPIPSSHLHLHFATPRSFPLPHQPQHALLPLIAHHSPYHTMSISAPPSDHASPLLSSRSNALTSARKKKALHSRSSSLTSAPTTHPNPANATPASPPLTLSHILGHTATSPFAHSTSPSDPPLLAYTAGSILCLYNPRTHSHSYIRPAAAASLACCAFAPSGQLVAIGEGGKGGAIHVYDTATLERVGGIDGLHEYGVRCIRWNRGVDGMLLSVGEPTAADEVGTGSVTAVCISDWRTGDRSSAVVHVMYESITAADCSEDGTHVVLCGDKGLTLLNLTVSSDDSRALGAFDGRRLTVEKQEVKLGPVHKSATFISAVCGLAHTAAYIFALTNKGVLCAFTQKDRKKAQAASSSSSSISSPTSPTSQRWTWEIEKWVDLRLETGYCLTIAANPTAEHKALLAIGGAEGKVRLFEPERLAHVATLPRPPPFIHAAASLPSHSSQPVPAGSYPPVLAVSLYSDLQRLVTVCADRTLVLWDIRQPQERAIGVVRSFVSHAGCIWDVLAVERRKGEAGSSGEEEKMTERERQLYEQKRDSKLLIPDQSLVTCAADNSLRFWHLSRDAVAQAKQNRNDKSKWSDQQIHCMHTPDGSVKCMLSLSSYAHPASLSARSDLLVTGDTAGMIRVWSLSTLQQVAVCAVSDKEVKCMEYDAARDTIIAGCRDGHIHTVDLSTLSDLKATTLPAPHSSAVTALAVTSKGLLLSISSDKSIVFRSFSPTTNNYTLQSTAYFKTGTPHHLILHPTDKYAAVCTSDRYIRLFDLTTQKESRQYRLSSESNSTAEPLRLALDGSGRLMAVCGSDRSVSVVEWFSGAVMCVLNGHGSVLTAVRWVGGGGRLVTVSADGCLFVWTVDERWAKLIRDQSKRLKRNSGASAGGNTAVNGLDSARSIGGGMFSARRRRSALEYLDDEDGEAGRTSGAANGVAGGLEGVSELEVTNASELELLDDEDKSEVRSPKVQPRPSAVPPLALPALSDERKEKGAEVEVKRAAEEKEAVGEQAESHRDYKPLTDNVPEWARTATTPPAVPPLSPQPPRSTRWSVRAQSGYKIVSELDREGVEVTPRVHRRRDEREGAAEEEEVGEEVEEEEGMEVVQEEKEETAKPTVMRGEEAEIEEDIAPPLVQQPAAVPAVSKRNSAPASPAAVVSRPSITPPAAFSPALPPRPQRDGNNQTPPPLSAAVAPSTPPQPPPRRSQPSSRSSSRNASPFTKPRQLDALAPPADHNALSEQRVGALLSPLSPLRALPAIPLQPSPLSHSSSQSLSLPVSPSLAQSIQSLQQQVSHTLGLFQQHKTANAASHTTAIQQYEQQLFSMHQQLTGALTEQRIEQLKQPLAASSERAIAVDELERSLTHTGSLSSSVDGGGSAAAAVAAGGGGVVSATLDRYSELLLDMVMKKLEMRNTREM